MHQVNQFQSAISVTNGIMEHIKPLPPVIKVAVLQEAIRLNKVIAGTSDPQMLAQMLNYEYLTPEATECITQYSAEVVELLEAHFDDVVIRNFSKNV